MQRRNFIQELAATTLLLGGCGHKKEGGAFMGPEMDFAAWVHDAKRFAERLEDVEGLSRFEFSVAPTMQADAVDRLRARWPSGIPAALEGLWTSGSEQFHCRYVWTPPTSQLSRLQAIFPRKQYIYGGARFEPAQKIFPGNSGVEPGDEYMQEAIGDDAYRLWCETAVILHVGNGDLIALDQTADPIDPPVVYLSHDDESSAVIAASLSSFLQSWAKLSYIGPEIWLLKYWIDDSTGLIDSDQYMTSELRELLLKSVA